MLMKSKFTIIFSLLLVFGLISLILFMTISDARLESDLFWVAFVISIPFNFILASLWTLWSFSKSGKALARTTMALTAVTIFTAVMLIFGLILMCFPFEGFTFPIIAYAVIAVVYAVVMLFMKSGAEYIEKTEKVELFVKVLEATVLDCVAKATEPATQKALRDFAEKVRFSDPVSHDSLKDVEGRLATAVYDISADLSVDPEADISAKLANADAMLASRNNHCKILKQCR